ncbi:MAG: DNA polymerase III subunit delta' [Rickettsia endosymbiont of Bryobia graminum]|nr:DNA polymerase III subunit delta' [Rickettsia endosymbiont of Bryobia graminum]
MIKEHLEFRFKQNRLSNSWLINTSDVASLLEDLHVFISDNLLIENIPLQNHPDYYLIEKDNTTTVKDISVEQIRELQQFFYKTPSISKYRVAIIYQAELMNLNAANSCLKLLEDTPTNGFIFLVTSRSAAIISTIRSRCAKFNVRSQNYLDNNDQYIKFITCIAGYLGSNRRLDCIDDFADKNRALWGDFSYSILCLLNKITKKSLDLNIELNQLEISIINQIHFSSTSCLIDKFINVKQIINNTVDYDLNLKASAIAVVDELFASK